MPDNTVLVLTGMGVPPYSARGLQQSLTHIDGAVSMRRTINGALLDIADPLFRKYKSDVTGSDQQPPALEGIWPGLTLTVRCIVELSVAGEAGTTTTEGEFAREAVPGSVRHDSGFTFYRPILTMKVTGFTVNKDEWGAVIDWTLNMEEV